MASILAVDDQKVMRDLVQSILQGEGHVVTIAEDGIEAMNIARETNFELILSDINMPNMGGMSLVSNLRRMPEYEKTPILMLTTESSALKKDKAKRMGASGWIQKPFDPPRLINAVNSVLAKAGHNMA